MYPSKKRLGKFCIEACECLLLLLQLRVFTRWPLFKPSWWVLKDRPL